MAILMTSNEVCEFLGITRNNLYQIQYRGHLKWIKKVGKNAIFDREQVEAYKSRRDSRKKIDL
jgi:excisionase family DNA binding protein